MTEGPQAPQPPRPDPIASVIPYHNSPALISYYLGLFSIFPVLGLFLAVAALILGAKGLQAVGRDPNVKGKAHAGIGIGCGIVGLLLNLAIVAVIVLVLLNPR